MSQLEETYWYVVYTRPRWEKKVAQILSEKGIVNYCPLNKVRRRWSDRTKVIYEPLFKGYVFVRIEEAHKWSLRSIDGILNYVHWQGKPARVREEEIDVIRKFLREFEEVEVAKCSLRPEDEVIVKQGVLMNYKGIIVDVFGNRARVRINSMGIQLSAIFDKMMLEPVVKKG
jgi:transcription antitermination factor NusG